MPTPELKIESYLALKYGITLDSAVPYVASDYTITPLRTTGPVASGTVWWNPADTTGYQNDIAGICKDETSGLEQPKSKSINPTAILTVELPPAAPLKGGMSYLFPADKHAFMWGVNGLDTQMDVPVTVATQALKHMNRIWKVEDNAPVVRSTSGAVKSIPGYGNLTYSIPGSIHLNLLLPSRSISSSREMIPDTCRGIALGLPNSDEARRMRRSDGNEKVQKPQVRDFQNIRKASVDFREKGRCSLRVAL